MRRFQVTVPDGRKIVHDAESQAELKGKLSAGYEITGEVLGPMTVTPALPDVLTRHTFMTWLIREHEPELREWFRNELSLAKRAEAGGAVAGG